MAVNSKQKAPALKGSLPVYLETMAIQKRVEQRNTVGIPAMHRMSWDFPESMSKQSTRNGCSFTTGWIRQSAMQRLEV